MERTFNHVIKRVQAPAAWMTCGARRGRARCGDAALEFEVSYQYMTGKARRLSTRRHYVCREHAERFACTHKLEMPAVVG